MAYEQIIRDALINAGITDAKPIEIEIIHWIRDRLQLYFTTDNTIHYAYIFVHNNLDTGKWQNRISFVKNGKHDRNIDINLRVRYGLEKECSIKRDDGYTVFEEAALKHIELEYIESICNGSSFILNNVVDLIKFAGQHSDYSEIREVYAEDNFTSLASNQVIWHDRVEATLLNAVDYFGHKLQLDAGPRYTSNFESIKISSFDSNRMWYVYSAMYQMAPRNCKSYVRKARMVGKSSEDKEIYSVMFFHTFLPLFFILSKYPRIAFNSNKKALKLLLEIGRDKGVESEEFKQRLNNLSNKVDRTIMLTRRKKYPRVTKQILSDEELLRYSEIALFEIDTDIKNGRFYGLKNRYGN